MSDLVDVCVLNKNSNLLFNDYNATKNYSAD